MNTIMVHDTHGIIRSITQEELEFGKVHRLKVGLPVPEPKDDKAEHVDE